MCSKLALVALFVCFAWANAVDVANLTKWYDAEVNFYERTTIQTRVIGGQPAARRQLPWHVLVGIESGPINSWSISSRFCAGSLISSHYVLSEANALRQGNRYELLLGAYDREDRRNVRRSNRVFFHPNSRPGLGNFNIAILEMTRAFTNFDLNVRPVQLAATGADYTGRYGWVSGFGSLRREMEEFVQWATVRTLTKTECQEAFPGVAEGVWCTIGFDTVHSGPGIGDGGTSLVALERGRYVQYGVYAFSWRNDFTRPSGYISVGAVRPWIRAVSGI